MDQTSALAELWLHLLNVFALPGDTPFTSTHIGGNTPPGSQPGTPTTSTIDLTNAPITVADIRRELWLANQDQHPDPFILRFLRARKFDVHRAYTMLTTALKWRAASNVFDVIAQGEAAIDQGQFSSGKAYYWQEDRLGRPVIYINARHHKQNAQSEEMLQRHTVYLMETGRLLLKEPVETVTIVFNLGGFGMANMDNNMVKFLINCLQSYYPESLGLCAIVNAPWIFSGIWKLIKPWLDPVVQAKIVFAKPSELGQYIDPANIPAELFAADPNKPDPSTGQFIFKYPPPTKADVEAHRTQNIANQEKTKSLVAARLDAMVPLEQATKEWATLWLAEYNPKALAAVAGGAGNPHADEIVDVSGEREDLQAKRQELCDTAVRQTWWALDNHIRFETMYHRAGVIKRGGGGPDWAKWTV
ncbi:CRAL-TRIO domain-containing protein [Catenaria anguillulae PL171]|uniref:CRAL-TRIO domain-containing protein n=1 Tax=Catenaria anguillulae PL171 TaxID=765915 RepID=A0A1Y2HU82_9FUNG|nr:CRAL-TRIO domain-containing protein [Catenaria anguillulae PL171]